MNAGGASAFGEMTPAVSGESDQDGDFFFVRKQPPNNYVCHLCDTPGHFIQHCPKAVPEDKCKTTYQGSKQCIGMFMCEKCKRKWESMSSWANTAQQCIKCKIFVYPRKQIPIIRKDLAKAQEDFHPHNLCEKCIETKLDCRTIQSRKPRTWSFDDGELYGWMTAREAKKTHISSKQKKQDTTTPASVSGKYSTWPFDDNDVCDWMKAREAEKSQTPIKDKEPASPDRASVATAVVKSCSQETYPHQFTDESSSTTSAEDAPTNGGSFAQTARDRSCEEKSSDDSSTPVTEQASKDAETFNWSLGKDGLFGILSAQKTYSLEGEKAFMEENDEYLFSEGASPSLRSDCWKWF